VRQPGAARRELQTRLAEAERRYVERNPSSARHLSESARVMPGGNTRTVLFYRPFPLVMARGEDCRLWDLDGHVYIDFLGEYTAGLFGHSHPLIRQAISEAVGAGLNLAAHNVLEARLAAALCARFPSLERVRFTNSGTEANLMALSLARVATGRSKIMVFEGAYHGSVFIFGSANRALNVPFEFVIAPYNAPAECERLLQQHAGDLAAVIVEPMLGSGGGIPIEREFLAMLRARTEQSGALLVVDEVMTSRLAPAGLHAELGIRPDLVTLGKYLGGGSSFGAFGGRAELMDRFDPRRPDALPHAGTFNNNVISMAAGFAAVTQVYTAPQVQALNARGTALRERLNALCRAAGAPLQFTGIGSLLNAHGTRTPIRSTRDLSTACAEVEALLFFELLEQGFYLARRGFMALSLVLGQSELDALSAAVAAFLERHHEPLAALETAEA
jgi:glutamate-1-semialdehyde 2,1-aminomutase